MTNRQQLLHQPRGFDFTSSIGIILKFAGDRRRSQETVSLKVFAVNYSEFRMIEQLSNWMIGFWGCLLSSDLDISKLLKHWHPSHTPHRYLPASLLQSPFGAGLHGASRWRKRDSDKQKRPSGSHPSATPTATFKPSQSSLSRPSSVIHLLQSWPVSPASAPGSKKNKMSWFKLRVQFCHILSCSSLDSVQKAHLNAMPWRFEIACP